MAYQQYQTVCQPNAWTAICEYRPTRKSLFVQCPQVATLALGGSTGAFSGGSSTLAVAVPLVKTIIISIPAYTAGVSTVYVIPSPPGVGLGGITLPPLSNLIIRDADFPLMSQSGIGLYVEPAGFVGLQNITYFAEKYQCRAIILATAQAPAVAGGPYGASPPGNWLSSDLSAGPANFRLQEALDGEQVTRQWFAWPIGSVAVSVTTSEAWDIVIPPAPQKMFGVGVPRLSPGANSALDMLISKMGMYDEGK